MALVLKNPPANAGDARDTGAISGSGRAFGEGNGNLLQYSFWKIPWAEEPGGLQSMGPKLDTTECTHTQCPFCICKWNLREWLRAKILDVPIDINLQVVSTWAPHHHQESPVGDLLKYRSILNSFASAGVVLTALPPFGEKICWETSEEKKIHCG